MKKTKYYIDYDYDELLHGPSNGSEFRPFKTASEAEDAAEKACVDDFILIDMDEDATGSKSSSFLNLEGCAAWSLILLIGGYALYFVIITLIDLIKNFGS